MVGGYKELQAAIFNADTSLHSAQEYCTLQKNTEPCRRILQAAAHTLVLIAVRCCASGNAAADLRNVRDTNAQTGCQNSRLLPLDVERNLKTRFY